MRIHGGAGPAPEPESSRQQQDTSYPVGNDAGSRAAASIEKATTGAVVSAYRPQPELAARVEAMLGIFAAVTIVDDGSGDDGAVLDACRTLGAQIVRLDTNSGIGAALNAGAAALRAKDPELRYLVTFDQDSEPPADILVHFERARDAAETSGLSVGSVSPGSVSGSRVLNGGAGSSSYSEVREPIQSGLLVPVDVLDRLGGFDEGLFIDGVDTEFYWRLHDAGLAAVSAPGAALAHALGTRQQARVLGVPLRLPSGPLMLMQSAPFRYYYIGRNRVHLLRRNLRLHPVWMLRGLALDLRHVGMVTLLGSSRRQRLGYFVRGVVDGLRGRTGKVPNDR